MPNQPVLIVNPKVGSGRAAAIDLFGAAQKLGLETLTMQPADDLASLASSIVDQGCDHLMMAGGNGSLAIVAEVAMTRSVRFSCSGGNPQPLRHGSRLESSAIRCGLSTPPSTVSKGPSTLALLPGESF